jgi:tRNA(Ile)-lysidine synthase
MKYKKYSEDLAIVHKINNSLIERNLIEPREKILISVSGGQDSICLMKILYQLQKKWQWQLGIVHCDHRWHINSLVQAKHVAQLAAIMEIHYYQPIAIKSVQQETIARHWRYDIIKNIAINHSYTVIMTAHTASDRIETLMYHLMRGTGLQGIQALNWRRTVDSFQYIRSQYCKPQKKTQYRSIIWKILPNHLHCSTQTEYLNLIRPLLNITRTEVRNLVDYWNLPCWPDPSNSLMKMRRNRIRNRLIPYIRFHYNPQCDKALARWAEIVNAENLYLINLTHLLVSKMTKVLCQYKNHGILAMNLGYFRSLPQVFQRRILRHFIQSSTRKNVSFNYIEHIRLHCLSRQYSPLRFSQSHVLNKNISQIICFYLPGGMRVFLGKQFLFCLLRPKDRNSI